MIIEDDRAFSVVLPNKEGGAMLKRTLDYILDLQFSGHIVICDSSGGDTRDFVDRCQNTYPDLWIDVRRYPPEIRLLDKLCDTLNGLESEYVLMHANDDFMVPAEVDHCVQVLEGDPGLSAAHGRIAMFAFENVGKANPSPTVALYPYPMRAYLQAEPLDRVFGMLEHYSATFYSVHRRSMLLENLGITERSTKNIIFFQYLSSVLVALHGKIWCGEHIFYTRQAHARSMSTELRRSDYEHWPLLITSTNFSRYYQEFRDSICRCAEQKLGTPAGDLGPRIDRAAAHGLFDRGYCQRETMNPEEEQFIARLNDESTSDFREFKRMIDFAMQYPETF